jgi:hypothetical protein
MDRFLLFAGDTYYPLGGWGDYKGSFPTLEEALKAAAANSWDWFHVVDLLSGEVLP